MGILESADNIPKAATPTPKELSRWVSIGIVGAAVLLGAVVLYHANESPRTDDAEVFANFIGIAPQVEGPIVRLNVRDNQFVKKGEVLYEIDAAHQRIVVRLGVEAERILLAGSRLVGNEVGGSALVRDEAAVWADAHEGIILIIEAASRGDR